jgi:hypothetical protein
MPIAASQSLLQNQIKSALSLDKAANKPLVATLIASAIASAVPMGLLPSVPSPIPLAPAGFAGTQSGIQGAFDLGPAATPDLVAQLMASAISLCAPLAPPAGLTMLQSQIASALKKDQAANKDILALELATAIVSYYTAGGIL